VIIDVGHQELAEVFDDDLRTRPPAIHSTMDFALISLGCSSSPSAPASSLSKKVGAWLRLAARLPRRLQAIAQPHLGIRRSSRRGGHELKDFLIVQTGIGERVEKLIFCIVTETVILRSKSFQKTTLLDTGTEEVLTFIIIILRINHDSYCVAFVCTFSLCV